MQIFPYLGHLGFLGFLLGGSRLSRLARTGNLQLLSLDSIPKLFFYSCGDAEEKGLLSVFS